MKSARSQPPPRPPLLRPLPPLLRPLPPLLRPMRLAVPDFQESDSPWVSSDDESEYYVSNEYDNNTDDEGDGYDSDLEYDKPICESYFQQVDESEGIDFPAVPDSPPVKEEIDSSEDESEDYVSNDDENSTDDEGEGKVCNLMIVNGMDYDSDLEYDEPIWERYFQQVDESEGFDIKDYPGPRPLATVYPLPHYLEDRKNYKMLKGYAERALEKYNDDKGTNHVVEKVLKVNGGGCCDYIYYLTFSVKTGAGSIKTGAGSIKTGAGSIKTSDKERDYFQAMVVEDQEDNLDFPIVRPRVKKGLDI